MSNPEPNSETTGDRLVLLYLLSRLDVPVGNVDLTRIVRENSLMDFFSMQQQLNELIAMGYVLERESAAKDRREYVVSREGRYSIETLAPIVPRVEKNRVDRVLKRAQRRMKDSAAVSADFAPHSEGRFIVSLKFEDEGLPVMNISMSAGSKDDSKMLCDSWKLHARDIYQAMLEILLKKRD